MSRLKSAAERLEIAIDRLDAAIADGVPAEIGEAEPLADELASARADYAALKAATETVDARLDGAIQRLRALLEA